MKKYILKNLGKRKIGLGEPPINTDDLHVIDDGDRSITVRNRAGDELFKTDDGLKLEGFYIEPASNLIKAAPLTAETVYVDATNGNDTLGELENRARPFKTFEAANNAIPAGTISWTIWLLSPISVSTLRRTNGSTLDLTILYYGTGHLIFSDCMGNDAIHSGVLRIDAPRATFNHINHVGQSGFGSSTHLELVVDIINLTTQSGNTGFFRGGGVNNIVKSRLFTFKTSDGYAGSYGQYVIGFSGSLVVTQLFTIDANVVNTAAFTGNSAHVVEINIEKIQKNNGTFAFSVFTGNRGIGNKMRIRNISGTGSILFIQNFGGGVELDFDRLWIDPNISLNICTSYSGTIVFTGIMDDASDAFTYNHGSGSSTFVDFKGKVQSISGGSNITYKFNNSYITCPSSLFIGNVVRNLIRFDNHNTVIIEDQSPIVSGNAAMQDIIVNGTLKTNASTMGTNANTINQAYTFKEKSKEMVVRSKWDLINKQLDPTLIYIIDGDIALSAGEHIVVPPGGISVMGYSFDASRLGSYGVPYHSIFKSKATLSLFDEKGLKTVDYPNCENIATEDRGRVLCFNGVSNNIFTEINEINHLYAIAGNPFSVGVWFKRDGVQGGSILCKGITTGSANIAIALVANNNNLVVTIRNAQTTIATGVSTDWHYVEVRFDGTTANAFFDGQVIPLTIGTAGNSTGAWHTYHSIVLGSNGLLNPYPSQYFKGFIKTVSFYGRARTDVESSATYNDGLGRPYSSEPQDELFYYLSPKDNPTSAELLTSGSGNIVLHNIAFTTTGTDAGVFDNIDHMGDKALEMITTNFEGCKKIGYLKGYRQGTGITIGFYGCADGLILDGAWAGFKLTNTNAFSFGATGVMFRAGPTLTFSNRFYLEINVDLQSTATISDVSPSNFLNNKLFQVNTTMAKIGGGVSPEIATSAFFPNISPDDPEAYFTDNVGLRNTMILATSDADAASKGVDVTGYYVEPSTGYLKVRRV